MARELSEEITQEAALGDAQADFRDELTQLISPEDAERIGINIEGYRFDPKVDFVFKAIFTSNTEESRVARIDFLSAILNMDVVSAELQPNELAVSGPGQKQAVFDMNLRLANGNEVNVEIQLRNRGGTKERAEFYVSKLHATQDAKGKEYAELHDVFEIMIANFDLFPKRVEFMDEFRFRNAKGEDLGGKANILFIELTKLTKLLEKPIDELSASEMWVIFLKYGNDMKQRNLVEEIQARRGGIRMAATTLDGISGDRAAQVAYISKVMHEMDRDAEVKYANRQGQEEKAREIAQKLMQANLSIEFIAENTGLPVDEVREIAKQNEKEKHPQEQPELDETTKLTAEGGRFVRLSKKQKSEGEGENMKEAFPELSPDLGRE